MYAHDAAWACEGFPCPNGIADTGIEAAISLILEGDGGLKVSGLTMRSLAGGGCPYPLDGFGGPDAGRYYDSFDPKPGPICNSWFTCVDWPEFEWGTIQLALHNLPAGRYALYSYHNQFSAYRWYEASSGTWVPNDDSDIDPPMPRIWAMSVKEAHDLPYQGCDAFQKLTGVNCATGPFPEGVLSLQDACNVPIQNVFSDDELNPSEIKFVTDGSPVMVLYKSGSGHVDPVRTGRSGGRGILNAFVLMMVPLDTAYAPNPINGSVNVSPDVTLTWLPGEKAEYHDVYLGTNRADVRDANTSDPRGVYVGRQPVADTDYAPPVVLDYNTTYYWRVDEVNDPNVWTGDVWSFTIYEVKAGSPTPTDGSQDMALDVELGWSPGFVAAWHDVYFGTDFDDVNDADKSSPEYKGSQPLGADTYEPSGLLDLGATYCWRIDEVGNPSTWKGDVWAFTVTDYIVVDDMESYNTSDNMISDTWLGGGYYNWTGAWLHLWIDPSEPVHAGRQSMKYDYDNGGGWWGDLHYYSEVARTFADPCDWSASGIKALALYFYGHPGNDADATEQMYVGLRDSSTYAEVKYGDNGEDMNDIKNEEWRQWNIALSDFNDVNLACVEKVYIGFGDRGNLNSGGTPGGSGVVYFDDIRLHITRCVPEYGLAADLNGDCSVGSEDFALLGSQWLQSPGSPSADIAEPLDGFVNWRDLAVLVDGWLQKQLWPAP
jgi:hypothetical protein